MAGNGLRQISPTLDGIAPDHRKRYEFASEFVMNENVLDAACGCGYGSSILARTAKFVRAIDKDHDACMYGMAHYKSDNVSYITGDITSNAFTSVGNFDTIVSFETIEHVENPELLLKVFASLGNHLIASVPNESVLPFDKQRFPFHYRHFTAEQLEELLTNSGWAIQQWYTQHDKWTGDIVEGKEGRTLIVMAIKVGD